MPEILVMEPDLAKTVLQFASIALCKMLQEIKDEREENSDA